jgi:hypothetical protein
LNTTGAAGISGVLTANANITATGSNYMGLTVPVEMATPTNSGSALTFDFTKLVTLATTNSSFVMLGLSGKDSTGKMMQWCMVAVTNNVAAGAGSNITFQANTHVIGPTANNLTNWTELLCEYWPPNGPTNVFVTPCW